ncbi:hypothetical protein Droror1_Dr00006512 [Drosera rotundifolia]
MATLIHIHENFTSSKTLKHSFLPPHPRHHLISHHCHAPPPCSSPRIAGHSRPSPAATLASVSPSPVEANSPKFLVRHRGSTARSGKVKFGLGFSNSSQSWRYPTSRSIHVG